MKSTAPRHPKQPELPVAWHAADYAALGIGSPNTFDDRVTEDIFDIEDERAEVDIIVHGLIHEEN